MTLEELLQTPPPDPHSPDFSYADALAYIEHLAEGMQDPQTPFEQAVACHKHGLLWIEACERFLDRTELQLKGVSNGENGPELSDLDT